MLAFLNRKGLEPASVHVAGSRVVPVRVSAECVRQPAREPGQLPVLAGLHEQIEAADPLDLLAPETALLALLAAFKAWQTDPQGELKQRVDGHAAGMDRGDASGCDDGQASLPSALIWCRKEVLPLPAFPVRRGSSSVLRT